MNYENVWNGTQKGRLGDNVENNEKITLQSSLYLLLVIAADRRDALHAIDATLSESRLGDRRQESDGRWCRNRRVRCVHSTLKLNHDKIEKERTNVDSASGSRHISNLVLGHLIAFGNPFVCEHLVDRQSTARRHVQHAADERFGRRTDRRPVSRRQVKLTLANTRQNLCGSVRWRRGERCATVNLSLTRGETATHPLSMA